MLEWLHPKKEAKKLADEVIEEAPAKLIDALLKEARNWTCKISVTEKSIEFRRRF